MRKAKIIEDNLLYEEGDEDEQEIEEAEDYLESEEEKLPTGPFGEIYPSSSSGEEIENGAPKRLFIPRCKMQAYK